MNNNQQIEQLIKKIEELQEENAILKKCNQELTLELKKDVSYINNTSNTLEVEKNTETIILSSDEKVKLFMSLFKGRTDVYAKRWVSQKTGKTGYSPVCKNDFVDFKCNKPKVKCSDCVYRELLPLTEDVILSHLKGKKTIGIYPLLQGDMCNFIVMDFDDKIKNTDPEKDVTAVWETCDESNITTYIEKSRSGKGIHVWIFFSEPVYARTARKTATILLTRAMDKKSMTLESYDRILPNQDTMPKGGFGNIIALPFQGECVKQGNTVFVDKYFEPYDNQTEILTNIKKLSSSEVNEFVMKNRDDDYQEPLLDDLDEDELPKKETIKEPKFENDVECIFDNEIYIKKLKLLPNEVTYLKRLASFTNPVFYEKQKLRLPIYRTPRIISCFEEDERFLILPRGCLDSIQNICNKSEVKLIIKDRREKGSNTDFKFNGKLKPKQKVAMEELLKYDTGILSAVPSFGKTVVSIGIIDKLKTNTLIVVHTKQLLDQWKERLSMFLDISKKEIGQIGGGKDKPNGKLDIAILQSLYKKDNVNDVVKNYGLVIVDECHHISAFSFEQVLKTMRAKHVYGLTATPIRKDGHHPIIYMQCGKIRYRITSKQMKNYKEIEHIVITRKTGYRFVDFDEEDKISITTSIYNDIAINEFRNSLIVEDIKKVVREGATPIILSERKEHLNILKEKLENLNIPIIIYKASMGKKETANIKQIIEDADKNNIPRIILATSKMLGEGFDDSRLDTLFLTMPVSWKGRITQYIGRLHRTHEDKDKVIVYDYIDDMKMLERMYEKRAKGYKTEGYTIL